MVIALAAMFMSPDPAKILLVTVSCLLMAATAPLAIELLLLTVGALLPARRRERISPSVPIEPLGMTVIVPAHDEQLLLKRCIRSLLEDLPADSSVLVVAHNCTDSTAEVAMDAGAEVLLLCDDGRMGKGAALRAGFEQALAHGAKVLTVVDADSVVSPGFSAAIAAALADGAEAFQARYLMLGGEQGKHSGVTALGFLGFNVIRPRGRSRLGISAGIFGNGFGFRSSVLERVPYRASSLVEDLEYHLRLVEAGIRVEFLNDATVSSEVPQSSPAVLTQRVRWEGGRLRIASLWLPRLIRLAFTGRPTLFEPALELASLPLASEVPLLLICLLLPVPWLRLYALACFAVIVAHIATAAAEGDGWWSAARTLLSVPGYIVWKLRILPRTVASSGKDAVWMRTARATPSAARVVPIDGGPRPFNDRSAHNQVAGGPGKRL